MSRSKSSSRWLKEHFNDHWVKQAQIQGWRSRAAFKLLELDEKDRLLKPNQVVVDLGAAPGGWSQVAIKKVKSGKVFALDILSMEHINDVIFIEGDFREDAPLQKLQAALNGSPVDIVLSDMAPNISGVRPADQASAMYLAELALDFACQHLRNGGDFVCKVFQGEGFDGYLRQVRSKFGKVVSRKPTASRPRSREHYLVARNFRT